MSTKVHTDTGKIASLKLADQGFTINLPKKNPLRSQSPYTMKQGTYAYNRNPDWILGGRAFE